MTLDQVAFVPYSVNAKQVLLLPRRKHIELWHQILSRKLKIVMI